MTALIATYAPLLAWQAVPDMLFMVSIGAAIGLLIGPDGRAA